MSLESIVQVTITSNGRGISRKGFGVPMVVARHDVFPERFREYTLGTAGVDMLADGFTTNSRAYKAVIAEARNTPKPTKVIVGRLLTDYDYTFDLTVKPIVAAGGELFAFSVKGPTGVVTAVSYTASPADTETVIALALETQLDAIADLASAPTAGVLAVSADNPNETFDITGLDLALFDFEDTTIDSNLVAEVSSIEALNSEWYGLILADAPSSARIIALANFVETLEKIFGATSHDTKIGDPGSTTDVAYLLNAAQLFRTFVIYSGDQGQYAAATWMGNGFPFAPGSQTWAFKPLSGVVFDVLTSGFQTAADAKSCNYYISIASTPITNGGEGVGGRMASGEYIDVIRGRDWTVARLRERIFGLLVNARKVPFTQAGIDAVVLQVEAQMLEGIGATYLSPDVPEGQDKPYIITAPAVADVSDADKIARLLPDVAFEAGLAGAIHATRINGSISV